MSCHNDVCVSSNLPLRFISFKAAIVAVDNQIFKGNNTERALREEEKNTLTKILAAARWRVPRILLQVSNGGAQIWMPTYLSYIFFFFLPSPRLIFNSSGLKTWVRCGRAEFNWLRRFCFIKPPSRQLLVTDPTYVWFIYAGIWWETCHLQSIIQALLESLWRVTPVQRSSVSFFFFFMMTQLFVDYLGHASLKTAIQK